MKAGISGVLLLAVLGCSQSSQARPAFAAVDQPPVVSSLVASVTSLQIGHSLQLTAAASDPNGDPVSYQWTQSCSAGAAGTFDAPAAASTGWTAGASAGSCTLTVTVTARGLTASRSVAVTVSATPVDHPPVVSSVTATPSTVPPGGTSQLVAAATDPDGNPISYQWTQSCSAGSAGTYAAPTAASTGWTAGASAGSCTLTVTATALGLSASGSATVTVSSTPVDNPPVVSAVTATPSTVLTGGTTQLAATASDPDGDPITYQWTQSCSAGSAGTFAAPTAASTGWTAGASAGTCTLTATATAKGLSASRGTTVTVTAPVDHPPVVSAVTATPSTVLTGGTTQLAATASDPDGDPITYQWTQSCSAGSAGTFAAPTAASTGWTAGASAGTCTLTATATAKGLSASRGTTVTVQTSNPGGGIDTWSYGLGSGYGHTPGGAVWDESPSGRRDTLVAAMWVGGDLVMAWGTVGGTFRSQTFVNASGGGIAQPGIATDHVNYDFHVIGQATNTNELRYWRLRPTRGADGTISGWTSLAHFGLGTSATRALGLNNGDAAVVAAIQGYDGVERIAFFIPHDTAAATVSYNFGATSSAAGVTPAAASDFLAANGGQDLTASNPIVQSGQRKNGSDVLAWEVGQAIVQRKGSRQVLVFGGNGYHGNVGPFSRNTVTPSGTNTWIFGTQVNDKGSDANVQYAGSADVWAAADGDVVWWIWDDGAAVRISRWNADGSVDWSPLPALGFRSEVPGANNIAVSPTGQVGVIVIDSYGSNSIRARVASGGAWSNWATYSANGTISGYIGYGAANIGFQNGKYQFGFVVSDSVNSFVYTASFPP